MRITFDRAHVQNLLELSSKTEKPMPILEQLVDPKYWRTDIPKERLDMLKAEAKEDGFAFSARSEDVDTDKLPRGLILVGDQGVYLMSQAPRDEADAAGVAHVAYAHEINPSKLDFDEWYGAKREAFGGDDGTIFLPKEALEKVLAHEGDSIAMELTPEQIGFYEPAS